MCQFRPTAIVFALTAAFCLVVLPEWSACAESEPIDIQGWQDVFAYEYDYALTEPAGLDREFEPVEVTLSVPDAGIEGWWEHLRVARLEPGAIDAGEGSPCMARVVPHDVVGRAVYVPPAVQDPRPPAPAQSVNLVFLARCAARSDVVYRIFWGLAEGVEALPAGVPAAEESNGLRVAGEAPALSISNEHYAVQLDPGAGAILTARLGTATEGPQIVFRKMPIHFGTDVWSPPQGWDHDYDWKAPPNQRCEGGATAFRYHRWGPMQRYRDVTTSITYTFYAHVPYVHVSSTMDFTEDRSARMVRMGEIVVDHSAKPGSAQNEGETPPADVFSHYAWPDAAGAVVERDVMASLDEEGWAALDGLARGALAILERDVPWVAAYDAERGYGMATLRRAQFAGNRLGGPIPHSAPCTYLSNYGWGFTYWSRPMVAPLGQRQTPLDRNTAIAAGTLFATEEALLVFEPGNDGGPAQERLKEVTEAQARFVRPLRFVYKGTGPW